MFTERRRDGGETEERRREEGFWWVLARRTMLEGADAEGQHDDVVLRGDTRVVRQRR